MIRDRLQAKSITILKQVHGADGFYVDSPPQGGLSAFEREGDFLITDRPGCAIGVLTADCLPIILYDKQKNAVAAIHSGWRGSRAGISQKAIERMTSQFGTLPSDLSAYFGACAKSCCYEVSESFIENFPQKFSVKRDGKYFFDNQQYVFSKLIECGVLEQNINTLYNNCTICNTRYRSYRREGANYCNQVTAVVLCD